MKLKAKRGGRGVGGRGDGGKWTVHIPKVDRKLVLGQSQGEAWLAGSTHMHFFLLISKQAGGGTIHVVEGNKSTGTSRKEQKQKQY